MGNVFDAGMFTAERFKETQRAILAFSEKKTNPECRRCFARTVCSSCIGHGASDGQGLQLDKKSCDVTKDMLRNTIIGLYNMTNQQPQQEHRGTVLNVSHCMCNPARMPVVPNRNEFFVLQKTRSQKCPGMYIFDDVLAVGFNTLCYDAEHRRKTSGIKPFA